MKGDRCTFLHPGDKGPEERKTSEMSTPLQLGKSTPASRNIADSDKPVSDNGWASVRSAAPAMSKTVHNLAIQREPSISRSDQDASGPTKGTSQGGRTPFRLKPADLTIPAYVPKGPRSLQSGSSRHSGSASPSGVASPVGTPKFSAFPSLASRAQPTALPQGALGPALHTPIKTSSPIPIQNFQAEKEDKASWPTRSPGSVFGKPKPLGGLTLPRVASPVGGNKANKSPVMGRPEVQANPALLPEQTRPTDRTSQSGVGFPSQAGPTAVSSPFIAVPSMPRTAPSPTASLASPPSQTLGAPTTDSVQRNTVSCTAEVLVRTQQAVTNSSSGEPSIPDHAPRQLSPRTPDPPFAGGEGPHVVQAQQPAAGAQPAPVKSDEHFARLAKTSGQEQIAVIRGQSVQQDSEADCLSSLPMGDADFAVWRKKLTRVSPEDFLAILKRDYPGLLTW